MALDDFGIGFFFIQLPQTITRGLLKIDGSFITDLKKTQPYRPASGEGNGRDSAGWGNRPSLNLWDAEETMQLLSKWVDYAQGYYIGKPCAVSEIDTYLEFHNAAKPQPKCLKCKMLK